MNRSMPRKFKIENNNHPARKGHESRMHGLQVLSLDVPCLSNPPSVYLFKHCVTRSSFFSKRRYFFKGTWVMKCGSTQN